MDFRGHRAVVFLSALGLCSAAAFADDPWPIQVQRRAHAGDIFQVHMTFEQTQKTAEGPAHLRVETIPSPASVHALTMPATDPAATAPATDPAAETHITTQTLGAELTCRVEVQDVNFRGETLLLLTIDKCVSIPEGRELVPAGKVIGMQSDAVDAFFTMHGGGEVSEEARTVLRHVYPLSYRLDEQSYGSKTARKAGESWEVDPESVTQMDSNMLSLVDKASVKGKVTLVGPEKSANVPALRLTIDLAHGAADRIRRPAGEIFSHEDLKSQMNVLLPVDTHLPALQTELASDDHAVGNRRKTEAGGKILESTLVVDTHTVLKQTITHLDK